MGAPVVDAAVTTSRFAGTDLGAIPDGPGPTCGPGAKPRDVHFNVSGISGPIRDVSVEFTLDPTHTSVGDLDVLLIAPSGASHRLFGAVSSTTPNGCGDFSDLAGPIAFSDDAPAQPTFWDAAASTAGAVPSGAYRASTNGGAPGGGQPTSITATFAPLHDRNGLWTLRLTDRGPSDTGTVASAALSIRHGNPAPPPTAGVLFDNGPLSTGTTTDGGDPAPPGAEWSELQHPAGDLSEANASLGVNMDLTFSKDRVADDFTVPAGETWTIESFDSYGFTSGLPAPGRFYSATLQVWTGPPSNSLGGPTKLFGDASTNRLAATVPTGIYRTPNTVAPAAADPEPRMIWRNSIEVQPPLTLPPGTYWAEWTGHAYFEAVAPQVTVKGARGRPGANGRTFVGAVGVWHPAMDVGDPPTAPDFPQDFAFRLHGSRVLGSRVADDPSGESPPTPDTTAPNTLIRKAPKRRNRKRMVKVAFSASEAGATFRCKLNRKPPAPCASPIEVKAKLGRNRFTVTATDSAGNSDSTPAVAKWVRKPQRHR